MGSVFRFLAGLGPAGLVLEALALTAAAISLLLAFILLRRAVRRRYLEKRDARTFALRQQWREILNGQIAAKTWRFDALDRDIVETIVLDRLEVAPGAEQAGLTDFLRTAGLLDIRIHEARALRGWRRRQALVSLGRMRAPEAIPALGEALEARKAETRLAAVRGLGHIATPEAAGPLLQQTVRGTVRVPERPLLAALLACCATEPRILLPFLRKAKASIRPLLARVLGEVAGPGMDEDLLLLSADPLSEVRAAAARALAHASPRAALAALAGLAEDEAWFVRLRAVVALGQQRDPRAIPVLLETLCDPVRSVRRRSAVALAQMRGHLAQILPLCMESGDRYALQALISELQRTGGVLELARDLLNPARRAGAETALLSALRAGARRMLLDALTMHTEGRVRAAVARLLAKSQDASLLPAVERIAATAALARDRRVASWLAEQLRRGQSVRPHREQVPA